jgi:predicted DCC family thiol-disulfide oxidoreductase YuxK
MSPYEEPFVGLARIGDIWEAEREGADEDFTMTSNLVAVDGDTAVVRIEVRYGGPPAREYRDLWVIRFADDRRALAFEEWPFWPGQPLSARAAFGAGAMGHSVLYDRDCGFCRWALAKILRWDRGHRLRPVALQDPEADRLLAGMPEEQRMASWHLVDVDGGVHSGGPAGAPLLRLLPGGRPLAAVLERTPRAAERGYEWVADHRSWFGRPLTERAKRRADALIEERRREDEGPA